MEKSERVAWMLLSLVGVALLVRAALQHDEIPAGVDPSFPSGGGAPAVVAGSPGTPPGPLHDLSALPSGAAESQEGPFSSTRGLDYGAVQEALAVDAGWDDDVLAQLSAKAIERYEVSEEFLPTEKALKALTVERWEDPEFQAWVLAKDPGADFPVAMDVETAWRSLAVQECLTRYLEVEHFLIELETKVSPSQDRERAIESARRMLEGNAWSLMQQMGQDSSFQSWIHLWRQWERWDKEDE